MTECVNWMWHSLFRSTEWRRPAFTMRAVNSRHGTGSLGHRDNGSFGSSPISGTTGHQVIILTRCETRVFPVFEGKPKVKIRWLSGRVVKFEISTQRQVIRKIKVWIRNIKKQQRIWGWCQHVINIAPLIKMRIYICGQGIWGKWSQRDKELLRINPDIRAAAWSPLS